MSEHKVSGVINAPNEYRCRLVDKHNPRKGIEIIMKFPKGFFYQDKELSEYPVRMKAKDVDTSCVATGLSSTSTKSSIWLSYALDYHNVVMDMEFTIEEDHILVKSAKITSSSHK